MAAQMAMEVRPQYTQYANNNDGCNALGSFQTKESLGHRCQSRSSMLTRAFHTWMLKPANLATALFLQ